MTCGPDGSTPLASAGLALRDVLLRSAPRRMGKRALARPFREQLRQTLLRRLGNAALGDEAGDVACGRHVEGIVGDGAAVGRDGHRLDGAAGRAPGHLRDLLAAALLDRDRKSTRLNS